MTNAHTVNTQQSLYRISVSVTQRNSHAYCILAPPQPQPPRHIYIPPTPPPSNVLQKLTTLKNKTKQNKTKKLINEHNLPPPSYPLFWWWHLVFSVFEGQSTWDELLIGTHPPHPLSPVSNKP